MVVVIKTGKRKNRKAPYKKKGFKNGKGTYKKKGFKNGNGKKKLNNKRYNKKKKHSNNDNHYDDALYVSQTSEAKPVAGKLNSVVREGSDAPQIYMMGKTATNVAVKAVAISRYNLKSEQIDLLVQPRFQRAEGSGPERDSFIFALRQGRVRKKVKVTNSMRISADGDAGVIAGAIYHKVAEGENVALLSIGATAVNLAVKSIVIARKYMLEDEHDIGFRPEFAHFNIKGEEVVGIKMVLYALQS